jgi:hypothetical protein
MNLGSLLNSIKKKFKRLDKKKRELLIQILYYHRFGCYFDLIKQVE